MWGSPSKEGSSLNLIMTGENFLFFSRQWEECLVFTTFLQEMSWSANRRLRDNSGLGWTKGQNIKWGNGDVNIIPLALIGSPGGVQDTVCELKPRQECHSVSKIECHQTEREASNGGFLAPKILIYFVDLLRVHVAQLFKFWCWGLMG